MKIFADPAELSAWTLSRRAAGARIALVPTMGCLHDGHLSLIAEARRRNAGEIVVSVFVNPVQFGPNEDYAQYPREAEADIEKCRAAGATAVFMPSPGAMYHPDRSTWVVEENLSAGFCGARRPGHFRGVCTVVAKLFNLAHPDFAVFGMKDFQQAAVVKRMARDLDFGIDIVVAPIVREPSGLAMSSRNKYLSPAERESALALSRSLRETSAAFAAAGGEMPWEPRKRAISAALSQAGLRPDYVEAADAETLEPVETLRKGCVVLLAAFAGKTRLIDNMVL